MIDVEKLLVNKHERTICRVPQLQVARGERVSIVGANGSGKTTLLRVLAGLERKFEGNCLVEASWKDCVYVHQSPYLFRGTVLFNVMYGMQQRGTSRSECCGMALHWLQLFGLHDMAQDRITHLSGGERRRVALARAMILQPRLLLLDEPLNEMDSDGVASVVAAFDALKDSTIVVTSPTDLPSSLTSRNHRLETSSSVQC